MSPEESVLRETIRRVDALGGVSDEYPLVSLRSCRHLLDALERARADRDHYRDERNRFKTELLDLVG